MAECYHRSLAGKVVWIGDLTRDEVAEALARAPWEWHTAPRGFAPWPPSRVRGEVFEPPSLADTMTGARSSTSGIWDR
jgi:hypothetical protein